MAGGSETTAAVGTTLPIEGAEDARRRGVAVGSEAAEVDGVVDAEIAGAAPSGDRGVEGETGFDEGGDMAIPETQIRTKKREAK